MERDTIRLSEHGRSSVRCRTWTFWSLLSACTTGDFDVKLMLIAIVIFNIFLFRMSFKTLSFDYFFLSFCISFVHFHLRRGSVYWIVLKKNCRKLLGLKRQKKCDTAIPYNEGININEDNLRSVGHIFDIVFFHSASSLFDGPLSYVKTFMLRDWVHSKKFLWICIWERRALDNQWKGMILSFER